MVRILSLLTLLSLTSCAGSTAWYETHPQKQVVEVNSLKWIVVPREGENRYDVLRNGLTVWDDAIQKKKDQIHAVEVATGCKVIESEYIPSTFILQTHVEC